MTKAAAPVPITAKQANDACDLIERHSPAADATTDVQVALGRLALWLRTNGQYPRPAPAKEPEARTNLLSRAELSASLIALAARVRALEGK